MTELLLLLLSAALVNNFVLVQFLGLCPFVGSSGRVETAVPMTLATMFVLTVAALGTYLVNRYLLVAFEVEFLRIIAFIVIIAATVQFTEMFVRAASPVLHRMLGIYLPLITTNCAVLGVTLIAVGEGLSLPRTMFLALGAGLGFGIAIVAFAALRERITDDAVPEPFRGPPLALVTVGFMALAFYGFKGLGG